MLLKDIRERLSVPPKEIHCKIDPRTNFQCFAEKNSIKNTSSKVQGTLLPLDAENDSTSHPLQLSCEEHNSSILSLRAQHNDESNKYQILNKENDDISGISSILSEKSIEFLRRKSRQDLSEGDKKVEKYAVNGNVKLNAIRKFSELFDMNGAKLVKRETALSGIKGSWSSNRLLTRFPQVIIDHIAGLVFDNFNSSSLFDSKESTLNYDDYFDMQSILEMSRSSVRMQVLLSTRIITGILARLDTISSLNAYKDITDILYSSNEAHNLAMFREYATQYKIAFEEAKLSLLKFSEEMMEHQKDNGMLFKTELNEIGSAIVCGLLSLCATLPADLPLCLLMYFKQSAHNDEVTASSKLKCLSEYLIGNVEFLLSKYLLHYFRNISFPSLIMPHSLRPHISYESLMLARLEHSLYLDSDHISIGSLQQMSEMSPYDKFVLKCRWSRVDTFFSDSEFVEILSRVVQRHILQTSPPSFTTLRLIHKTLSAVFIEGARDIVFASLDQIVVPMVKLIDSSEDMEETVLLLFLKILTELLILLNFRFQDLTFIEHLNPICRRANLLIVSAFQRDDGEMKLSLLRFANLFASKVLFLKTQIGLDSQQIEINESSKLLLELEAHLLFLGIKVFSDLRSSEKVLLFAEYIHFLRWGSLHLCLMLRNTLITAEASAYLDHFIVLVVEVFNLRLSFAGIDEENHQGKLLLDEAIVGLLFSISYCRDAIGRLNKWARYLDFLYMNPFPSMKFSDFSLEKSLLQSISERLELQDQYSLLKASIESFIQYKRELSNTGSVFENKILENDLLNSLSLQLNITFQKLVLCAYEPMSCVVDIKLDRHISDKAELRNTIAGGLFEWLGSRLNQELLILSMMRKISLNISMERYLTGDEGGTGAEKQQVVSQAPSDSLHTVDLINLLSTLMGNGGESASNLLLFGIDYLLSSFSNPSGFQKTTSAEESVWSVYQSVVKTRLHWLLLDSGSDYLASIKESSFIIFPLGQLWPFQILDGLKEESLSIWLSAILFYLHHNESFEEKSLHSIFYLLLKAVSDDFAERWSFYDNDSKLLDLFSAIVNRIVNSSSEDTLHHLQSSISDTIARESRFSYKVGDQVNPLIDKCVERFCSKLVESAVNSLTSSSIMQSLGILISTSPLLFQSCRTKMWRELGDHRLLHLAESSDVIEKLMPVLLATLRFLSNTASEFSVQIESLNCVENLRDNVDDCKSPIVGYVLLSLAYFSLIRSDGFIRGYSARLLSLILISHANKHHFSFRRRFAASILLILSKEDIFEENSKSLVDFLLNYDISVYTDLQNLISLSIYAEIQVELPVSRKTSTKDSNNCCSLGSMIESYLR